MWIKLLDKLISKSLSPQPSARFQNAMELLDALDEWKPRRSGRSEAKFTAEPSSKTALGMAHSSPDQQQADEMAKRAISLKKEGKLADAADLMEEAFNKSPDLRDRYSRQVRLWRCGISM